jgi:hypothetical protein
MGFKFNKLSTKKLHALSPFVMPELRTVKMRSECLNSWRCCSPPAYEWPLMGSPVPTTPVVAVLLGPPPFQLNTAVQVNFKGSP